MSLLGGCYINIIYDHELCLLSMFKFNGVFQEGKIIPNVVKVGDQVMLPEFGGTKIVLENEVIPSCHV